MIHLTHRTCAEIKSQNFSESTVEFRYQRLVNAKICFLIYPNATLNIPTEYTYTPSSRYKLSCVRSNIFPQKIRSRPSFVCLCLSACYNLFRDVRRGAPVRIQGRCRSLQDLPSASWHHPQKWLHRHQRPRLQGFLCFTVTPSLVYTIRMLSHYYFIMIRLGFIDISFRVVIVHFDCLNCFRSLLFI